MKPQTFHLILLAVTVWLWAGGVKADEPQQHLHLGSLCVGTAMFVEPLAWTGPEMSYGQSFYHLTMGYACPAVGTEILGHANWWLADLISTGFWVVYYIAEDQKYSFRHFMATETGTLDHAGIKLIEWKF